MTKKYELLPPSRGALPAKHDQGGTFAVTPSRVNPGGIIESTLMRWEADRHRRTIGAVTARTRGEADLFDAQAQMVASYIKRLEAAYRLQELPEVLANDRARRRAPRNSGESSTTTRWRKPAA